MTSTAKRTVRIALFTTIASRGAFAAAFAGMSWALRANGVYDVDIVYYKGEVDPQRNHYPSNIRFVKLEGGRGLRAMGELRRYLDRVRPDFLITAPVFVNVLAILVSAASRWRWSGGKLIITHHHPIELAHQNCRKDNKWLAKVLYRFASGSFGVSPSAVIDACRETYLDPARVACIPNILAPVDLPLQGTTHPWLDEKDRFVFVSVSRLVKLKNIDHLIRTFAKVIGVREARLLICGDGPERDHLEKLVHSMGLDDRVVLCGYVENARLFMSKADAFVLASNEEGFGQVFTEAMSVGCPIISTRCLGGGAEYVLDGGRYGILVPCDDEEALEAAMLRMMDGDIRESYAAKSRERVRAFMPEQVGRDLIDFLTTCQAPRPARGNRHSAGRVSMTKQVRRVLRQIATSMLPQAWHAALWRSVVLRRTRATFGALGTRDAFERIYATNLWGGEAGEFRSGSGSSDPVTTPYVDAVRTFVAERGIGSIADLGCGDFQVGRRLVAPGLRYVGVDIVRPLVERNQTLFANGDVSFEARDLIEDPLPDAELALLRQVLQHLSNEQIGRVLENTRSYRYLLVTEHVPVGSDVRPNLDKPHGPDTRLYDRSGVFLELPPFSLSTKLVLETRIGLREMLRTVLVER